MRLVYWNIIKLISLIALVISLYAFASARNNNRQISKPEITFLGENNLFITESAVSKLLIQNNLDIKNVNKETLDLNRLEAALSANPMIQSAEVYLNVNGNLKADVQQKMPIARVLTTGTGYYIDSQGTHMPLSSNYTARVPLVTGRVDKKNIKDIYEISKAIYQDDFLEMHVTEIHKNNDGVIYLKLRHCPFTVQIGTLHHIKKKINNLKAFYKKAKKENKLQIYSNINLQFDNQVVCTKS